MGLMLVSLRLVSIIGFVLFGWLFVTLMQNQGFLERSAVGFVEGETQSEITKRYPTLGSLEWADGLSNLAGRFLDEQMGLERQAEGPLPTYIATVISAYCGCRENHDADIASRAADIRAGLEDEARRLGLAQSRLSDVIVGQYDRIIDALRQDLLIFLGTNAIAFALVFGASFTTPHSRPLVIYPAALLVVAIGCSSLLYLFNTNWFYAILFEDYWGYTYAGGMLVIFVSLCDILLNHARLCRRVAGKLPTFLVVPGC